MTEKWWESAEISKQDVFLFRDLYNDLAKRKTNLPITLKKDFDKTEVYQDVLNLVRLIYSLKARPLEYLTVQFDEYVPPTKKSRKFPTFRSLYSPAAVLRWKNYLLKKNPFNVDLQITEKQIIDYNKALMNTLKRENKCDDDAILQDIFFVTQFNLDYLKQNFIFQDLIKSGYYQKAYNLDIMEVLQ
jgi:hypothetical protein